MTLRVGGLGPRLLRALRPHAQNYYFTIDDWDSLAATGAYYVYRYKSQRMVWTWSPEARDSLTGNIVVTR